MGISEVRNVIQPEFALKQCILLFATLYLVQLEQMKRKSFRNRLILGTGKSDEGVFVHILNQLIIK